MVCMRFAMSFLGNSTIANIFYLKWRKRDSERDLGKACIRTLLMKLTRHILQYFKITYVRRFAQSTFIEILKATISLLTYVDIIRSEVNISNKRNVWIAAQFIEDSILFVLELFPGIFTFVLGQIFIHLWNGYNDIVLFNLNNILYKGKQKNEIFSDSIRLEFYRCKLK